jgi:hypothetical protein
MQRCEQPPLRVQVVDCHLDAHNHGVRACGSNVKARRTFQTGARAQLLLSVMLTDRRSRL